MANLRSTCGRNSKAWAPYALQDFRSTMLYSDARTMPHYDQGLLWFCERLLPWKCYTVLTSLMSQRSLWNDSVFAQRPSRSVLSFYSPAVYSCWVSFMLRWIYNRSIFRIIRLAITCALQLTIMRRFEKMIGCVRLALIYFVSGIGGYLASASFVPYMVCF